MTRPLTRRAFLRAVATGTGALGVAQLLGACGAPEPAAVPTAPAQEPTATIGPERTVEVWYYDDSLAPLVDAFQRANPGTAVRLTPNFDIEEALLRALPGGANLPDVCAFSDTFAAELAARGGLLDLAAAPFDAAGLRGDFVASAWAGALSQEGRLAGVPLNVYPGSFWYRADLLEAAGLDSAPEVLQERLTSWEALLTLAQELRAARPESALLADAVSDVFFTMWLQQGGVWLEGTKLVIEERYTAAAQAAVLARRQKLDADLSPGGSAFDEAMRSDQIAGLFAPSWFQGYVADIHFNQVGRWRVLRAPGGDFNQGAVYLGIPAGSRKQEAAWEFVRYCCATVEGQNTFLRSAGDFPAYVPAWSDPLYDAPVSFFGDQHAYRLWSEVAAAAPVPPTSPHTRAVFELLYPRVRDVVADGGDPAQALRDAEAAIAAAVPGVEV
jgi:multiple sugar transport system substrate-binding protein